MCNYIVQIIHCRDIYFCDINCEFEGHNKNNKTCTFHVLKKQINGIYQIISAYCK